MQLTKRAIESAALPDNGQIFLRDDEVKGLGVRVTAGGAKTWVLEVRFNGRPRRFTLGRWGDLDVAAARAKASKWRGKIADGVDPTLERKEVAQLGTFREFADRFLDEHSKLKKRSWKRDEARIKKVFMRWNSRRLGDITRAEVVTLQQKIAKDHGQVASNRAMTLLCTMFNTARAWGVFKGENPVAGIDKYKEHPRTRFLNTDEVGRLNEALAAEKNEFWRAYFALLLILGLRRNELLSARWADVDFKERTLTIPTTKTDQPHRVPLPEPAIAILKSLSSCGNHEYLFPGDGKSGHLAEPMKAWQRIRARAGNLSHMCEVDPCPNPDHLVENVTIHDLRRTLGSWLAAAGYGLPMIGRALNHADHKSTQIYARLDLDPVRRMLEQNAAAMLGAPAKPEAAP